MSKFTSKCANQVLCKTPSRVQVTDGIVVPIPGKHIRFDRGEFCTADDKEIDFIRNHRLFGVEIWEDARETETAKERAAKSK